MATTRFILDQHGSPIRRVMQFNPAETNSREGGAIHFLAEQDVDVLLAANRRDAEIDQRKNTFRHVCRMPLSVWERACREGWQNDDAAIERWMRDPDNRAFLVNGKL